MRPVLIPLKPGSKVPIPQAVGWQEADAETVESWWEYAPAHANVALRCDGLVVLDADDESAMKYLEETLDLHADDNYCVRTPRGAHYYWLLPEGVEFPAGKIIPKVDLKTGPKHYVLVPPSVNADGVQYRVMGGLTEPAPLPDNVREWIESQVEAKRQPIAEADRVGLIPAGNRNNMLTSFAGLMRRQGLDDVAVSRVLNGLNRQLTEEPLPDSEIEQIVRSSSKWEAEDHQEVILEPEGAEGLFIYVHEMEMPPPTRWLFEPYIPFGRLTALTGLEGIGKGMYCVHCVVEATRQGLNVLWLSAEDDPVEDIQRRLKAAGYRYGPGIGKVAFFREEDPRFPRHKEALRFLIEEHEFGLIVLDPGRSYLASPDGVEFSFNNEAALRPGLQALAKLAAETGVPIIFVHHWNKNEQTGARFRSGGSAAFSQVVRHRVDLYRPDDSDTGAMAVTKSNIIKPGHVHTYSLLANEEYDTAVFQLGEPVPEFPSLDHYIKQARDVSEHGQIELDPADQVLDHLAASHSVGEKLRDAKVIAQELKMRHTKVTEALREIEEMGYISRGGSNGLHRFYTPPGGLGV